MNKISAKSITRNPGIFLENYKNLVHNMIQPFPFLKCFFSSLVAYSIIISNQRLMFTIDLIFSIISYLQC